jgi:hypothetical protein
MRRNPAVSSLPLLLRLLPPLPKLLLVAVYYPTESVELMEEEHTNYPSSIHRCESVE